MITHSKNLSEENLLKQQALFSRLSELTGAEIKTIPDYFRAIDSLGPDSYVRDIYSLFRLPVDEPIFTIDANTRKITVPHPFDVNGIGVVGDHLCEVVCFSIDRFYDMMDLSTCTCHILWHNKTTDERGQTKAALQDWTEEEVLFCWPINDLVTQASGTVEFSVRFFKLREGTVDTYEYSFSTATATVDVKNALEFNANDTEVEDFNDLIVTRPIFSSVVNTIFGPAPQITVDLSLEPYDLNNNGTYTLNVNAVAVEDPENYTIVYRWYKNGKALYNNGKTADELTDEDTDATLEDSNSIIVTSAGTYHAEIGCKHPLNGTRYISTNKAYFPDPKEITLTANTVMPAFGYMDEVEYEMDVDGAAEGDTVIYKWYHNNVLLPGETDSALLPDEEGDYYGEATNSRNNITTAPVATVRSVVRLSPVSPISVTITDDIENHIMTCHATFPSDAPQLEDEYRRYLYQWYSTTGKINGATEPTLAYDPEVINKQMFYCAVWVETFGSLDIKRYDREFSDANVGTQGVTCSNFHTAGSLT